MQNVKHPHTTGQTELVCAFYDPEGFRRFRSTGTENAKIARTICVNIERAATLTRQGRLANEKALKLVRETGAAPLPRRTTNSRQTAPRAG